MLPWPLPLPSIHAAVETDDGKERGDALGGQQLCSLPGTDPISAHHGSNCFDNRGASVVCRDGVSAKQVL